MCLRSSILEHTFSFIYCKSEKCCNINSVTIKDNSFHCICDKYCDDIIENKYYNELKYMQLSDKYKVEDNKSDNNLYTKHLCTNDATMTNPSLKDLLQAVYMVQ